MVPPCLKQASHLDKERCKHSTETSYESIMPVFGSDQYFYKNSFCARCNFVKHYQLLNLTAKLKTEIAKHENPYQRFMNCFFKVFRTKTITNYIKTCNRNIFDRWSACNKTSKYYKMCSSYLGVVGNSRNYHCLVCKKNNTENSAINLPKFACPCHIVEDESDDSGITAQDLQWSFTIGFAKQAYIIIRGWENSFMIFCDNGKMYNIISSKCERFSCSKSYKKAINGCIEDKDVLQNPNQVVPKATFDKCLIRSNITLIVVMHPSKEKRSERSLISKVAQYILT